MPEIPQICQAEYFIILYMYWLPDITAKRCVTIIFHNQIYITLLVFI